ncbi:HipA family kinase [Dyadobacter sandarakinus]|uniref:Aminotransferase class I and II n=1 Tax=Dyadobacter sandarakinus TaxID=2747268 RepID=A0ABX7I0J6_9BACT|nr:HipA family kinase [Dyadobacter sandarakinus]QRQ99545.1 aminotransferase class I and II [Dyadobacter sandarakinus]
MNDTRPEIRDVQVIRYVTPLREGGSLPAIAEADDGFLYVLKFKGAGQGTKALIAELIGGELARKLGLKMPEIVFAHLDEAFGRTEPDEEIQDLLRASTGLNLAMHYLSGAFTFDPVVNGIDADTASKIVWLDSFITNVDRTARNTNMLVWHKELWLIDHGASLYFHHTWNDWEAQALKPFVQIKDHVLLRYASRLPETDAAFREILNDQVIENIVSLIPDDWLLRDSPFESPGEHRQAYTRYLSLRLSVSDVFVKGADDARALLI